VSEAETSGANPIAPPATPSSPAVQTHVPAHANGFTINARTVVLAMTLFAGGGVGGGSASFFAEPKGIGDLKTQVEKAGEKTDGKLETLGSKVDTVAVSLVDVKAELRNGRKDYERLASEIKELKDRVRELERRRR
jgi:hypothetical protein